MLDLYIVYIVPVLALGAAVANYLTRKPSPDADDLALTRGEYVAYTLCFLLVPYACVLISSTLYYVWRQEHPRKAKQINRLGFIVFGAQFLLMFGYGIMVAAMGRVH